MIKFIRLNIIFAVGLILGLGLVVDERISVNKIDPQTREFYKEYISYIPDSCKANILRDNKIVIRFEKLDSNFIGFCNRMFKRRLILLDSGFWSWTKETDKKQLLFHELSHCLLNKDHVDNVGNYMYPTQTPILETLFIEQVKLDIQEYCTYFKND